MAHIPVLLREVVESLDIHPADIVVDGTINGGGHSRAIIEKLSSSGILIGIDVDRKALELSSEKLRGFPAQVNLIHGNFRNLDDILDRLHIHFVDKILLDLGWSSNQFEDPDRGFSFLHDGPLLMTLSGEEDTGGFTAYTIVNYWEREPFVDILKYYGEEKYAERIVDAILEARKEKKIQSTLELAKIIERAVPLSYKRRKIHPATKTFQALRIAVNDEIFALKEVLEKGFERLQRGGRMAIITFHSIEDRIVKRFFLEKKGAGEASLLTKKPQVATREEIKSNRRARSAKLRVLIKN